MVPSPSISLVLNQSRLRIGTTLSLTFVKERECLLELCNALVGYLVLYPFIVHRDPPSGNVPRLTRTKGIDTFPFSALSSSESILFHWETARDTWYSPAICSVDVSSDRTKVPRMVEKRTFSLSCQRFPCTIKQPVCHIRLGETYKLFSHIASLV
jgi:hypothetical protein